MDDPISAWLQSPDKNYQQGLGLLAMRTKNRYLMRSLSLKASRENRGKLLHELKKLARPTPPPRPAPQKLKPAPAAPAAAAPPEGSSESAEPVALAVEKLEVALTRMHNKKGMLSNELRQLPAKDNLARKALLERIDGLNTDMGAIQDKLDYFKKNGKLPPLAAPEQTFKAIPADPVEMKQTLLNLRSSRTKITKQMRATTPASPEMKKLENRLAEKQRMITEIERKLNGR
jgi:hypothetical protein